MKMVPFPEHLDPIAGSTAGEYVVIDDENYVVAADDGRTFQVTVEADNHERVPDIEVIWNESKRAWEVIH